MDKNCHKSEGECECYYSALGDGLVLCEKHRELAAQNKVVEATNLTLDKFGKTFKDLATHDKVGYEHATRAEKQKIGEEVGREAIVEQRKLMAQPSEDWERTIAEMLKQGNFLIIPPFISRLIATEREAERGRIIGIAEEMRRSMVESTLDDRRTYEVSGYNAALTDLLARIKG